MRPSKILPLTLLIGLGLNSFCGKTPPGQTNPPPPEPLTPILNAADPSSGPTTGNVTVHLTGTGFANGATVTIAGIDAPVTFISDTQLDVTLPPNLGAFPSKVPIVVTDPDGNQGANSTIFSYFYGNVDFLFKFSSPVGPSPNSLAEGDVDGDQRSDLVTTSASMNNLSIISGHGDGSFGSAKTVTLTTVPPGTVIGSVVLGSLNPTVDQKSDIAVVHSASSNPSNFASVLIQNMFPAFTSAQLTVGNNPAASILADLNNDGKLDLVVVSKGAVANTGSINVRLGNGDGTFQAPKNFPGLNQPVFTQAVDLNQDGILDLAVAEQGNDTVTILPGIGDGTFGPFGIHFAMASPKTLILNDVNGDGITDIIAMSAGQSKVGVLLGNPNSDSTSITTQTFVGVVYTPIAAIGQAMGSDDFDKDGKSDLFVADGVMGNLELLLGKGDGTFQAKPGPTIAPGSDISALIVTDLDGDGKSDIALANHALNQVDILMNHSQ